MTTLSTPPDLRPAETELTATEPTDVWYTVCPVPAASSLAIARGELDEAFRDGDVRLNSIRSHPDRKVREAHYDQSQPNAFREGGNVPPLWAKSVGRNLRVIGLSWVETYSAVLALPGSGIREPGDLRGKRLGLIGRPNDPVDYPRATSLRGYHAALESAGLGFDDVTLVNIPITETLVGKPPEAGALSRSLFSARLMRRRQGPELRALLRGEIDALYLNAQGAEVQALLDAEVVFDVAAAPDVRSRINNLSPTVFTVRGELLDSRPDIVARYLARAIRTARWAKANPVEAKRGIARDSGIAEEWVDAVYTPEVAAILEPTLDDHLIALLEDQKNFLLRHGFLGGDFSVPDWIARGPLEEALRLVADDPR
ncbi:ABC-type nitrate/sulfonate/bicarbonate transport system substrate-binding protein [Azospirillum agricola]|uniref:ABC transporter substrate-binding protein n=1 Tax=Azospirillum agricola TaxID=1720247 RepID=UPI001AE6C2E9|nr:ABC transporter substrate-binding protein [Azospirillum agricola]MBP2231925.1 ABC-type nitrate/sulfonate/bicarbonate transport system substrate-binding protein [Azospirillum agricola]